MLADPLHLRSVKVAEPDRRDEFGMRLGQAHQLDQDIQMPLVLILRDTSSG